MLPLSQSTQAQTSTGNNRDRGIPSGKAGATARVQSSQVAATEVSLLWPVTGHAVSTPSLVQGLLGKQEHSRTLVAESCFLPLPMNKTGMAGVGVGQTCLPSYVTCSGS